MKLTKGFEIRTRSTLRARSHASRVIEAVNWCKTAMSPMTKLPDDLTSIILYCIQNIIVTCELDRPAEPDSAGRIRKLDALAAVKASRLAQFSI